MTPERLKEALKLAGYAMQNGDDNAVGVDDLDYDDIRDIARALLFLADKCLPKPAPRRIFGQYEETSIQECKHLSTRTRNALSHNFQTTAELRNFYANKENAANILKRLPGIGGVAMMEIEKAIGVKYIDESGL